MKFFKQTQELKNQIRKAVLLLRFHTVEPRPSSIVWATYVWIAKSLKLEYATVQHICKASIKRPIRRKKVDKARVLEQIHIDFLTSAETLKLWAAKTLLERTVLFHRKFANKRIAITSLRRLYLNNKVKRKVIRHEKRKPEHVRLAFDESRRDLIR
jgi:hypothetical protein